MGIAVMNETGAYQLLPHADLIIDSIETVRRMIRQRSMTGRRRIVLLRLDSPLWKRKR